MPSPSGPADLLAALARALRTLDLDLIRSTLRMLEEALGQSDPTPAFDAEVSRWRTTLR